MGQLDAKTVVSGDRRTVPTVDPKASGERADVLASAGRDRLQKRRVPQVCEPAVRIGKGRRRSLEGDQASVGGTIRRLNVETRRFARGGVEEQKRPRRERAAKR